jgi:25S rRNA (uracil2634-N3)-methyltransferase
MKRKAAGAEADRSAQPQQPQQPQRQRQPRARVERDCEGLQVLRSTLRCAHGGCVPCCYKLILHAPPGSAPLQPNQRPEMCPRAALQAAPAPRGSSGSRRRVRRRCGLYDDRMAILTVGDGDFSFSLALARALYPDAAAAGSAGSGAGGGGRLVATSHESEASVLRVYPNAAETLAELRRRGVAVYHDVDGTDIQSTLPLLSAQQPGGGPPPLLFDRVVWNFPCIGRGLEAGHDGQNTEMDANKQLVRQFCCSAARLLRRPPTSGGGGGGGEVHITHKTKPPYNHWGIVSQAATSESGLLWDGSVIFDRCSYPPYINRKALGEH